MRLGFKSTLPLTIIAFILISLLLFAINQEEYIVNDNHSEHLSHADNLTRTAEAKSEKDVEKDVFDELEASFIEQGLASSIEEVALAYKAQSRYPHYSVPVVDQALAATPKAFEVTQVSMPTFDEDGEILPFTISAATDKPEYVQGETITIQVTIEGADDSTFVDATAVVKATQTNRPTTASKTLIANGHTHQSLQTTVNSDDINIDGDAQEFLAVITANINGREHVTSVPFLISRLSAELLRVENVEQIDDYLAITLGYRVHQTGYYFVQAYLDDAESNKALLSLQTEGKMRAGSDKLVLKAHHQALKDAGSQGPYNLRIMRSFRGAKPGESNDVPSSISQKRYTIPDFAFDGYADIPYSDPSVENRIQALMSLTSGE